MAGGAETPNIAALPAIRLARSSWNTSQIGAAFAFRQYRRPSPPGRWKLALLTILQEWCRQTPEMSVLWDGPEVIGE